MSSSINVGGSVFAKMESKMYNVLEEEEHDGLERKSCRLSRCQYVTLCGAIMVLCLVVAGMVAGLVSMVIAAGDHKVEPTPPSYDAPRFNCLPENDNWNATYAATVCNSRNCLWNKSAIVQCAYPESYSYYVEEGSLKDTPTGMTATMLHNGTHPTMYGNDIAVLTMEATYETPHRLRVKVRVL